MNSQKHLHQRLESHRPLNFHPRQWVKNLDYSCTHLQSRSRGVETGWICPWHRSCPSWSISPIWTVSSSLQILPHSSQSINFRKPFSSSAICRNFSSDLAVNLSVLLFWSLIVHSKDACLRIPASAYVPVACITRLWATPFIALPGGSSQNKPCGKLTNRYVVWNEIFVEWMPQSIFYLSLLLSLIL